MYVCMYVCLVLLRAMRQQFQYIILYDIILYYIILYYIRIPGCEVPARTEAKLLF